MDNFAYRARRILTPALAHLVALGDPVRSVWVYSWLNLAAWLGLAAAWWALLPTGDWRRTAAWAGLLFCVGALHSVRFALADLPAMAWFAAGWLAWERRRLVPATLALAASALSRETMLVGLAVVALATWQRDGWRAGMALGLGSAAPVGAWLLFLGLKFGFVDGGWDNFEVPVYGFVWKWAEGWEMWWTEPNRVFALTTPLATAALTVTLVFFARVRRWAAPEWWLGVVFALMALTLHVRVWEGNPGAAPRVLLPLTFAFWLGFARWRAAWPWAAGAALALPAGLVCLWWVSTEPRELDAGRLAGERYLVETGQGFFPTEHGRGRHWAWCSGQGELVIRTWPRGEGTRTLTLECLARSPRRVEVHQGGRLLWSGEVGPRRREIELPDVRLVDGRAPLRVSSDEPPVMETGASPRALSFALYGVTLH